MQAGKPDVQEYQQRCFREYQAAAGLPDGYSYLYGNPIQVLVPVETACGGLMIVGAYPSAKFFTVQGVSDVPLMDNDAPFSSEVYFDGQRVRSIPSGQELNEHYLTPLGIPRAACWITDLVKVFLFKPGHISRYQRLGRPGAVETRSRYLEFAVKSLPWLAEEARLAAPRAVLLLGVEVTSVVFGVTSDGAKRLLDGKCRPVNIEGIPVNAICLPHPGILMKPSRRNPWPERFAQVILPQARQELIQLGLTLVNAGV